MKKLAYRFTSIALSACAGAVLFAPSLRAAPLVPPNLANGLDELVSSNLTLKRAGAKSSKMETFRSDSGQVYATQRALDTATNALTDESGDRLLVRAHLNGLVSLDDAAKAIAARVPSFSTVAVDRTYKGGVIEGYVSIDDVPALAYSTGVRSVALEMKPDLNKMAPTEGRAVEPNPDVLSGQTLNPLGTAFDAGVFQHRVDQINKFYNPSAPVDYEGANMSIGFISDSFNTLTTGLTRANTDVANFDLPGAANNPVPNTQAVVVLQDVAGTDEGRGMGQIIYKMAPKARIAFATGNGGEVNFANNIRALAGLTGFTYPAATQQGFAADAICDDLGYGDEPFFEDGIVAGGVNDVFAAGVSYFSSAGNDIGTYDYDSDYRNVQNGTGLTAAAGNTALAGTNINLANVPAGLYAGGFHNFRTDGGLDVAQTVNETSGQAQTNFQWDDPYNQTVPVIQPAIYHNSGNHPGSGQQVYTIPNSLTAGTKYVCNVFAQPGSAFDAIVTITDPSNNIVAGPQDTGTDETVQFIAPVTGPNYHVIVESFGGTTGAYNVDLYFAAPANGVTTDFNLLAFRVDNGAYLPGSSLVTNNISSNVPFEFGFTRPPAGQTQVQFVIARSNNPPASPQPAGHLRWIIRGNGAAGIGPAEYITINTPNTKGHAMAKGCNGVAAYPILRPSLPEYFTSPGPATVYFDNTGNRLNPPDVRLQPGVAAADGGNTSFFGGAAGDAASDFDTKPQFSGTSAAAPHAVAIAALVLEAHGGRGSVTPTQMMNLLHNNAFTHDLDPWAATGSARTSVGGKVSVRVDADRGLNPSSGAFNPNSISLSYVGPGTLSSFVFNPAGTAATGGAVNAGNNGLGNATQNADGSIYFSNIFPGVVFQPLPAGGTTSGTFVFGNGSVGLTAADVSSTMSNAAPSHAGTPQTNQFWTLNLNFPNANFTGGKILRFSTGHAQQHDSTVTNAPANDPTGGVFGVNTTQADLFGGGVQIPEGTVTTNGMSFSGTTSGGGIFTGVMVNRLGAGWSPVDGFGFINAQTAVAAPLP